MIQQCSKYMIKKSCWCTTWLGHCRKVKNWNCKSHL